MAPTNEASPQYAALEARVSGIEGSIHALSQQIGSLSTKLDERSRTPWSVLIAAISLSWMVMGGLGYSFLQPLKDGIGDNRAEIREIKNSIVSRGEHEQRWQVGDQKAMDLQRQIESLRIDMQRQIDGNYANSQRQIDDVKQSVGGIYSPKDAIRDIKDEIREVKDQMKNAK